ncbi:hypothetical protein L6452_26902 [Arctium lappa]|uniref:Uncharacterized protein n=1 Tax=Arctium lappa TaxID=4217 RepID=A0ACB8ZVV0_ARCLA|nr:hypothetical protein L6452_26902 [Arctium lappa]
MRKFFKDSLKALEADIQHANTLALDYSWEYDGSCLQMRLSYSPYAQFFLFYVQMRSQNLCVDIIRFYARLLTCLSTGVEIHMVYVEVEDDDLAGLEDVSSDADDNYEVELSDGNN